VRDKEEDMSVLSKSEVIVFANNIKKLLYMFRPLKLGGYSGLP